ncbi:hypothetical protein [Jannaschia formosa]|uniref:hypothetical protein n=1 Tax=Jannaschia formosa TaxID=2259592 RepID=UPI000E1BA4A4|nr:hypothetical protein [Jannaschia formosa]TFL19420.1 hypothetical protein DR046_05735 [Jannaschia formosa]
MPLERLAALALLGLAACNTGVGTELTRATAKSVVNPIVAQRFPGVPLEPATDCVIDNATGQEIVVLASSAASRDDATASRIVTEVAQRPETIRCFAENALPEIIRAL